MADRSKVYKILFACVADARRIRYSAGDERYRIMSETALQTCGCDTRQSLLHDNTYTVNYIGTPERIWMCVAEKELSTRIVFAYLEAVRKRSGGQTSPAGGQDDSSLPFFMASTLQKYSSSADRSQQIQEEIDAIRAVMVENVNQVLKRGEDLELFQSKSAQLKHDSSVFKSNAAKVKNHLRCANIRWYCIGFAILAIIVLAIVLGICGISFKKCSSKKS